MRHGDYPAAPCQKRNKNDEISSELYHGLTKREHFAALAMQGILSNSRHDSPRRLKAEGMAMDAVLAADALLAELDETPKLGDRE